MYGPGGDITFLIGYGLDLLYWGVGLGSLSCPVVRVVLNTGHVPQTTSGTPVIPMNASYARGLTVLCARLGPSSTRRACLAGSLQTHILSALYSFDHEEKLSGHVIATGCTELFAELAVEWPMCPAFCMQL